MTANAIQLSTLISRHRLLFSFLSQLSPSFINNKHPNICSRQSMFSRISQHYTHSITQYRAAVRSKALVPPQLHLSGSLQSFSSSPRYSPLPPLPLTYLFIKFGLELMASQLPRGRDPKSPHLKQIAKDNCVDCPAGKSEFYEKMQYKLVPEEAGRSFTIIPY